SKESTRCVLPIMDVWLATTATFFPVRRGRYSFVCSAPVMMRFVSSFETECVTTWPHAAAAIATNNRRATVLIFWKVNCCLSEHHHTVCIQADEDEKQDGKRQHG